jgi:probable F420-dependent oxidoreductase
LLIPEHKVLLCTEVGEARRRARTYISTYLTLPNYVRNLRSLGFDNDDLCGPGSDRLVDALVAWGDDAAIASRLCEMRAAGADHVVIQPLCRDLDGAVSMLERLAPALAN